MWNTVLNILKSDFVQKILLLGIIGLLIMFSLRQCETNNAIKWQAEQNQKALVDTLKVVKDKVGGLAIEKTAFATSLDEMKNLNKQLYAEAKEINGKVKTLQNVNTEMLITEIRKAIAGATTVKTTDSVDYYTRIWNENFTRGSFKSFIEGYTNVTHVKKPTDTIKDIDVTLTRQEFALDLKTYVYENSDGFLVGGVAPLTPTPGLTFKLETGIFDPTLSKKFQTATSPKNWVFGFGPYFGVGYGSLWNPGGTVSSYQGLGWSAGIGFTLSYKIFAF